MEDKAPVRTLNAYMDGKTWHTWHTDQQKALPLGAPTLMMGFTQDGQANEQMAEHDKRFGVASAENRQKRSDIAYPTVDPDADAWQKGVVIQLEARKKGADKIAAAQSMHATQH
jgi:hypothetical protein